MKNFFLLLTLIFCASKVCVVKAENLNRIKNWGLGSINALKAWEIYTPNKVIVAVIDTGVDTYHDDLQGNIWSDPSNPFIHGWDFVTNRPNPTDYDGHGTHIAGIISANLDLNNGVSGVSHQVSIMSVKYYSDANPGSVNLSNTVKAINYAVEHGARIINYSGGGPEFSEEEYLAIKKAEAKGVLFVAAAGNEHQNTDLVENYYYPASYRLPNVISVAAIGSDNKIILSSNWGKKSVDVAAPGENIFSTLHGNRFAYMTGTSQATAFVSGIAALLLSKNPKLTPEQIKRIILNSVDHVPQLENKVNSQGKANAFKALNFLKNNLQ